MPAGFFHTLPIIGAMFMGGTTQDGEPMMIITSENPERVQGFDAQLQKEVLERFHLECFRADHVLQVSVPPFSDVARGSGDRPDFVVDVGDRRAGLDCAALADHQRRLGFRLMEHLRARLVEGGGGRDFSGVAGCVLSIWFGESLSDLPPKRWDDSVVDPLLDSIADCRVDHAAIARLNQEIAERGFPQVMPPVIETRTTSDGAAGFVANALLGPMEGARFSTGLGFDVQLQMSLQMTATSARANLERIRPSARQARDRAPVADRRRPRPRRHAVPGRGGNRCVPC